MKQIFSPGLILLNHWYWWRFSRVSKKFLIGDFLYKRSPETQQKKVTIFKKKQSHYQYRENFRYKI